MDNRLSKFQSIFLHKIGFEPTEDQKRAAQFLEYFIFSATKVFILKGYAGTGKTTLMGALIKTLPAFYIRTILLAPTGRAAKVLSLKSSKQAFTIHKHIYYTEKQPDKFSFKLRDNKTKNALFIVDESSMIGLGDKGFQSRNLLEDFFYFVKQGNNCKIIFIGDTAQLPPVGEDFSPALNDDFIKFNFDLSVLSYQLTQVVRQALNSNILKNASNLRYRLYKQNYSLPIFKLNDKLDFKSISAMDFEDHLRECYSLFGVDNTIVITRSNKAANILNNTIRYKVLDMEFKLDTSDNLMAVKNNYFWIDDKEAAGFIANGDILKIKRVMGIENKFEHNFADIIAEFVDYQDLPPIEIKILLDTLDLDKASLDFQDESKLYWTIFNYYFSKHPNKAEAKKSTLNDQYFNAVQVKFANVLTCHKAQGGGWDAVFIFQNYFQEDMLNRDYFRWLYTAVTRSQKRLYLVNFDEEFFVSRK